MGVFTELKNLDYEAENFGRIIGGTDALTGEFPHQIQLKYFGDHLCGASLISSFLVLTAAHCVIYKSPRRVKVVSGEHRLSVNDSTEQFRDTRQIFVHEDYNEKTYANDIALLLLANELQVDNFTKLISLPKEGVNFSGEAVVTGWGRLLERVYSPGDTLQKVMVPIVPRETCNENYGLVSRNITENQICAGAIKKDSCKADSGGPLTCTEDGQKYLCGIVSFGFGCGRERFPGVYTNVAKYIPWINSKIKEIRDHGFCPPDFFRCKTEHDCIPVTFTCDDDADCTDGTDEFPEVCNGTEVKKCRLSQFRCVTSGQCLSYLNRCNGINDCGDNSDEDNCFGDSSEETVTTTESVFSNPSPSISAMQPIVSSDFVTPSIEETGATTPSDVATTPEEFSASGVISVVTPTSQSNHINATSFTNLVDTTTSELLDVTSESNVIDPTSESDASESNYIDLTTDGNVVDASTTTVKSFPEVLEPSFSACPGTMFRCHNHKCISSSFLCDQENDCGDNSDEANCISPSNFNSTGIPSHCNSHQFRCKSNKCIPASFKCDGDFDCGIGDASDEDNCPESERTCASNQFQCQSPKSCIPASWKCDQEFDCEDHSDEADCAGTTTEAPVVIQMEANLTESSIAVETGSGNENAVDSEVARNCSRFQFKCKSGECVSRRWRCDGRRDCVDGSDERNCYDSLI